MNRVSLFALLVTTAALAACGSKSGGNNGPAAATPLTQEQRQRFDRTADAISESTTWQSQRSNLNGALLSINPISAPSNKPAVDKAVQTSCVFTNLAPDQTTYPTPGAPIHSKSGLTVDGVNCPIEFAWANEMDMVQSEQNFSMRMNFQMSYAAKGDLARGLDVRSYKLNYGEVVEASGQSGKYSGSGTGRIESASQGTINMELSVASAGDANNGSLTRVTRFVYPDGLVVELKEVTIATTVNTQPTMTYFINDTLVSAKEYTAYMQKIGMNNAQQTSSHN